jgi:hypothetical protein
VLGLKEISGAPGEIPAIGALAWATFLAWNEEHKERLKADAASDVGRPRLTVIFTKAHLDKNANPNYWMVVHNWGGRNASDIKIKSMARRQEGRMKSNFPGLQILGKDGQASPARTED